MTKKDIDNIISIICPNDEDFEKPIISPAYLKNELEALALEQDPCNTCGYEEGSIYCKEHCPYEAKIEQEPCKDAISRQAVLDMATTIQTDDYSGNEIIEVVDVDDVKALPPVTPQPKTGHWISHHHGCEYECSECHDKQRTKSNYCTNCGAKMIEPGK